MEDVVYDKTYGGKESKAKVDSKITAFKKKHAAQISANKARLANQVGADGGLNDDDRAAAGEGEAGLGYAMEVHGDVQVRAAAKVDWPAMPEPHPDAKRQNKLKGEELRIFKTREAEAGGYDYEWGKQRNAAQCCALMAQGLQL